MMKLIRNSKLIKYIRKSEDRVMITALIISVLILIATIIGLFWKKLTTIIWFVGSSHPESPYAVSILGVPTWIIILSGTIGVVFLLIIILIVGKLLKNGG